ncbi:MAG: hypothetical protein A2068_03890 [Ignavibacteria bacterium GWB2_35_6b]|nr:MAG: hypothetical protein A2068_03890 [Ignavibacteria bacterium GWB2_35_6b]
MNTIFLSVMIYLFIFSQGNELVKYAGSLKGIMKGNDISSKINLNDIKNKKNLYALGAAENLEGEIQIFNGEPFNSEVVNRKLVIKNDFQKGTALLVYANVKDWNEYKIDEVITDLNLLQQKIELICKTENINSEKPFPFLIKGSAENLSWHVVSSNSQKVLQTHEEHKSSGLSGELKNEAVEIIGFYSNKHQGIITHHSTNIHLHFKNGDKTVAGHIDELKLKKNFKLYFSNIHNKK